MWYISALHIAGMRFVLADLLSQFYNIPTGGTLDPVLFCHISCPVLGLMIDLSATREIAQIPCFFTPFQDYAAVSMDSMSLDRNRWYLVYLFPPGEYLHAGPSEDSHLLRTSGRGAPVLAQQWLVPSAS